MAAIAVGRNCFLVEPRETNCIRPSKENRFKTGLKDIYETGRSINQAFREGLSAQKMEDCKQGIVSLAAKIDSWEPAVEEDVPVYQKSCRELVAAVGNWHRLARNFSIVQGLDNYEGDSDIKRLLERLYVKQKESLIIHLTDKPDYKIADRQIRLTDARVRMRQIREMRIRRDPQLLRVDPAKRSYRVDCAIS